MTHPSTIDPLGARAAGPDGVLRKRKRAARQTLVVHLMLVIGLGAFMLATEGPSAPLNAGQAVTLARVMEVCLAVAAVSQVAFIARWAWLAVLVRRLRRAGSLPDALADMGDYYVTRAQRAARLNRGVVAACVVLMVACSWLPEIGYLAQASYQVSSGGYGEVSNGTAIAAIVIFVAVAGTAGLVVGVIKLTDRMTAR